uniref:Uncharacterized protein n=1 Tax=Ditylenchus dipsaci TaxID=166011 RepID=A0A915DY03_9BILA
MTTSREARSDLFLCHSKFDQPPAHQTGTTEQRTDPDSHQERSQRAAKSTNSFCRRNGSQVLKSAQLCVMMRLAGDEGGGGAASDTSGTHSIHSQV